MDMGTAALAIMGFVAAGAMGWFGTAFLGRPIRHFFDLRGEVIRRWTSRQRPRTLEGRPQQDLADSGGAGLD